MTAQIVRFPGCAHIEITPLKLADRMPGKRQYVTRRPRAQWCEDDIEIWPHEQASVTVFEDERAPEPTGLLDKHGNELMAIEEPNPCGFVSFSKESL